MSVILRLADEIDVPRGEMLVAPDDQPTCARSITATVCWMSESPVKPGARLAIKHTTRWARAILDGIDSKLDVETLDHVPAEGLQLNDIATVRLRLSSPLMVDPYEDNRVTGAFILTDEATNDTVAAGMVVEASA
jgi:sulfate adenylyltransferase subunit 1